MIDPVLQQVIDGMAASGLVLPDPLTAAGMRAVLNAAMPVAPIEVAEVRAVELGGVGARLYHPLPGTVLPVVVLMHGGGWVVGTLDTHDGLARILARDTGFAVVSLDYRLAPEHPYPAPLDDCLVAIRALPEAAGALSIDPARVALAGDSAGGNLAAAAALALKGTPHAPRAQLLFYPVTDADFATASYRANEGAGGILSNDMMRFFWNAYVGDAEPDPLAAPLRASDVAGVAPAIVILAANDPLHDEGFAYAVKLHDAGVPTDLHDFAGGIHGFASFFGIAPIADQAIAIATGALKRAMG